MLERERPDPLLLERYLLGVLSEAEKRAFEARWPEKARATWAAEHAQLQQMLMERYGPQQFAERVKRIQERQAQKPGRSPALRLLAVAAMLSCLGLFGRALLERAEPLTQAPVMEPTERAKGLVPALRVYRKTPSGSERLPEQAVVRRGEVLQLSYLAPGLRHGVIVAIDGAGNVTPLFPSEPGGSTLLATEGGEHLLDLAYELDEAPEFERFVLVASASELEPAVVLAAARTLAQDAQAARSKALPLAPELTQASFVVRKGAD